MRDGSILTYYPADDQTKNGNECLSKNHWQIRAGICLAFVVIPDDNYLMQTV
jgi:hypothetical protein